MTKPADTHGKVVAMIAWGKTEFGEDDVAVFMGVAQWHKNRLIIGDEEDDTAHLIREAWYDRIQPVPEDMTDVLADADYCFSVTVGEDAKGDKLEDGFDLLKSELDWPDDED